MLRISELTVKPFKLCNIIKYWKSNKTMYSWMQWVWLLELKKENLSSSLLPSLNGCFTIKENMVSECWFCT